MFPGSLNKSDNLSYIDNSGNTFYFGESNITENDESYRFYNNNLDNEDNNEIVSYNNSDYPNDYDSEDSESGSEYEKISPENFTINNSYSNTIDDNMDIDNTYEKITCNRTYNYEIFHHLKDNLYDITDRFVYFCFYTINNDSIYPFLQYVLIKNIFLNILQFPYIFIKDYSDIQKEVDKFISKIGLSKECYQMHGYKNIDDNTYLFIQLKDVHLNVNNNNIYLALIDEIMNVKNIYDLKIENTVSNFFYENVEFLFLKDENNQPFEIPIVAYQGIEENKMNFTFMFGLSKSDFTEIMGPYFYFTNYSNVIHDFNSNKKFGIIRYGLFLGSMKIPMNFLEDEIDNSDIKKELLKKPGNKHSLTLRISDHDGNWSKLYDSVYIGRTILDDGTLLEKTPRWVVRNYHQQFSLSCKIIRTKIQIN